MREFLSNIGVFGLKGIGLFLGFGSLTTLHQEYFFTKSVNVCAVESVELLLTTIISAVKFVGKYFTIVSKQIFKISFRLYVHMMIESMNWD